MTKQRPLEGPSRLAKKRRIPSCPRVGIGGQNEEEAIAKSKFANPLVDHGAGWRLTGVQKTGTHETSENEFQVILPSVR